MKKVKRWSCIVVCVLLLCGVLLFTACNSDQEKDENNSNDMPNATQGTQDSSGQTSEHSQSPDLPPLTESTGLDYSVNKDGKTCSITGIGTCTDSKIVIPKKIDEYIVTRIGFGAFRNCTNLTAVIIPDSVTSIDEIAFHGCFGLTSISLPDSVTSIDNAVFWGCTKLIQKENGVSYVDKWAIDCDKSVTNVVLRENTVGICNYLFRNCENLTSITIPDSVIHVGKWTFECCDSLTNVIIGNGVINIDDCAFYNCIGLTSITIGNSVTRIGNLAFEGCISLKTVYYIGTAEQWAGISTNSSGNSYLTSATIYYYSASQPTTSGNYWHYVDGVPTKW